MNPASPDAIDATLRALHGENRLEAIIDALADWKMSRVIAFSDHADPTIRDICALATELPSMVITYDGLNPQLQDLVWRIMTTDVVPRNVSRSLLDSWMYVAPAGWGKDRAKDIMEAVQLNRCSPAAAAALIGPCDDYAALLDASGWEIHDIVRCWGQTVPDKPTWWTNELSPQNLEKVVTLVKRSSTYVARAAPWLPPEVLCAPDVAFREAFCRTPDAAQAFRNASPEACSMHRDTMLRMAKSASTLEIRAIIAHTLGLPRLWDSIDDSLLYHPCDCDEVLSVDQWEYFPSSILQNMLDHTQRSLACAIFASASGMSDDIMRLYPSQYRPERHIRITFFASIRPRVWDAMEPSWREWWCALLPHDGPKGMALAIRSLGLRPEILCYATDVTDGMVNVAFEHHACMTTIRRAFFPLTLRNMDGVTAHAIMSALPEMPVDRVSFFSIASKRASIPPDSEEHVRILSETHDLPVAVALQRVAETYRFHYYNDTAYRGYVAMLKDRMETLRVVLGAWTGDSIAPLLEVLDSEARNRLCPDAQKLASQMSEKGREDELRTVIEAIAALPPAQALRAQFALGQFREHSDGCKTWDFLRDAIIEPLTDALRSHGDLFVALYNSMHRSLRSIILPPPSNPRLSEPLLALARTDPLCAYRLASAWKEDSWLRAYSQLTYVAPPDIAGAIVAASNGDMSEAMLRELGPSVRSLAIPGQDQRLIETVLRQGGADSIATLLALGGLAGDDVERQTICARMLIARPDIIQKIAPFLRRDIMHAWLQHDSRRNVAAAIMAHMPDAAEAESGAAARTPSPSSDDAPPVRAPHRTRR